MHVLLKGVRGLFFVLSGWLEVFTYVFFFQAEDGIRDGRVTGVQTCALPISRRDGRGDRAVGRGAGGCRRHGISDADRAASAGDHDRGCIERHGERSGDRRREGVATRGRVERNGESSRSEERRVGKEGRYRWW